MKISDVIHGKISTLELRRSDDDRFPDGLAPRAEIFLYTSDDETLRLRFGDDTWEVEGEGARDEEGVRQLVTRELPRLCWLVQKVPAKGAAERLLVQVHEFPKTFVWNEPVEIGVDDRILEDMRKRRRSAVSIKEVVNWLTDKILLHPKESGGLLRAVLSGSPSSKNGRRTAFRLYGAGHAIDVERGTDDKLRVTRVVGVRKAVEGNDQRPIYLVAGQFSFCDITLAGQFRGAARTELDHLVEQADSYLGLWREYNRREQKAILSRARQVGWAAYSSVKVLPDGSCRFHIGGDDKQISELWQKLDLLDGEQLEAGVEVPAAIQGLELDKDERRPRRPFVGELSGRRLTPPSLTVRPAPDREDRVPPEKGFLFVSLAGDQVRIDRRTGAWNQVKACTNPMPQLGLIIEGQAVPERHGRKLKPMTPAVREVFPLPNDRQRLALAVVLNTPDIALIQGPPGTGKTRVIAALMARLAEKDEGIDPNGLSGNTLLTSFQHDAVENAATATQVMGLPAVKVGRRHGSDEVHDGVEAWDTETAQKVRAARAVNPAEASIQAVLREVREVAVAYIRSPNGRDDPGDVLRRVSELASPWLPAELAAELGNLRGRLRNKCVVSVADDDREFVLKAVRSLRTDPLSFSDDGPITAHKVLCRLRRLEGFSLTDSDIDCLEQAATMQPNDEPAGKLFASLETLRDSLIDRLQTPSNPGAGPRTDADVEGILVRVIDALSKIASETAPAVDVAVGDWLEALENDPEGIREAVQHYSMVLAATCQQSVGRSMADAKHGEDTVFRTVIVDEAARSNPLDLLIPMARGERRIVLVGDHRQLPHVLEPDIEHELQQSVQEATRDALYKSLFEKLFLELRERERRGEAKRTVTLNVQYRMHPVLGQFVSRQFYEPYGEGFESGRPAEEFEHDVSLKSGFLLSGKVAVWLEVPFEAGPETEGRSKGRPVEARRLAQEAEAIISRLPTLSVGVITFYASQRDEILSSMANVGLTEPDYAGGFRVRDQWRRTSDGRERLRIGTVDAFQGKEFDVVLLSLTRSNRVRVKDEASRRRRYGFLLLENRLCVAMSRQHRLLILVGDPAMAHGPEAEASVPALVAFKRLCEESHGTSVRT